MSNTHFVGGRVLLAVLAVTVFVGELHAEPIYSNSIILQNPHWEMMLTDYGYSDYLGDLTPGFEGREYLSGEWAAALSYQVGATVVTPTWIEPQFIFPDWATNSTFLPVTPISATGQKFGGLDAIAASTVSNGTLTIGLAFEMVDTVIGMKMGTSPESAASGAAIDSNRYVLKQTYTITNASDQTITNLSLYQFLHGLNSVTSVYDDRNYGDPNGEFRHDTTQVAVDPTYAGSGSTFRDYIGFGSNVVPEGYANGLYGTMTADDHGVGKPSVGVHLEIEADTLNGDDYFSATEGPDGWVSGAQKYNLPILAPGQSVSIDLLLGILTGTEVSKTGDVSGSANGGASCVGGVDYHFEKVITPGAFYAEYDDLDEDELDEHINNGDIGAPTFVIPGDFQVFELEFDGEFDGDVELILHYDPTLLGGFNERDLRIYHYIDDQWEGLPTLIDAFADTATVTVSSLSPFGVGIIPEPASIAMLAVGGLALLHRRH